MYQSADADQRQDLVGPGGAGGPLVAGLPQVPDSGKGAGQAWPGHSPLRAAAQFFDQMGATGAAHDGDQPGTALDCLTDLVRCGRTLDLGVAQILALFGDLAHQRAAEGVAGFEEEHGYVNRVGDGFKVGPALLGPGPGGGQAHHCIDAAVLCLQAILDGDVGGRRAGGHDHRDPAGRVIDDDLGHLQPLALSEFGDFGCVGDAEAVDALGDTIIDEILQAVDINAVAVVEGGN